MTDLHTHILPGMDDGAQSVEEALEMLRVLRQQGVDTVALTPHFYADEETITVFLSRRQKAWEAFFEKAKGPEYPKLILGAEVAWMPEMSEWPDLDKLCYQDTSVLLVELPTMPWTSTMFQQLYSMENRRGVMPMIAHIDRYFSIQRRESIEKLLETGYPIQISCDAFLRIRTRKKALKVIAEHEGVLISDCHNLLERAPRWDKALKIIKKRLGSRITSEVTSITDEILAD